jgi:hypothetical protein
VAVDLPPDEGRLEARLGVVLVGGGDETQSRNSTTSFACWRQRSAGLRSARASPIAGSAHR